MANYPVTINGNLTEDPYLTRTSSGAMVARLRVAADRRATDAEGRWYSYDNLYITVEAWGDLAYNAKVTLAKGMPVMITGFLVTHTWKETEGEGEKNRSIIKVKARNIGLDLNRYCCPQAEKSHPLADAGTSPQQAELSLKAIDKDQLLAQSLGEALIPAG